MADKVENKKPTSDSSDSDAQSPTPVVAPIAAAPAAPSAPAFSGRDGGAGGGPRGGRRGPNRRPRNDNRQQAEGMSDLSDKVVHINRCSKVVKGGRRFSFSALVVVGDKKGKVGIGFGKANEVADAVKKATENARKGMEQIALKDGTIPHEVFGSFDGGKVLLKPASQGTGIIAGSAVRAVVELAGVKDILSKSLGSDNPYNVVKATLDGLRQLRTRETIFQLRGKRIHSKNTGSNGAAASGVLAVA